MNSLAGSCLIWLPSIDGCDDDSDDDGDDDDGGDDNDGHHKGF